MKARKQTVCIAALGLLLALCGCMGAGGEASPDAQAESRKISVAASFSCEDGTSLRGGTVRLAYGETSTEHPLDDAGETSIAGLPRAGELLLTILDRQEQRRGTMTLAFSEGAVIDAVTDENGVGHITARQDTNEIALLFILRDDGSLLCTLRLSQSVPSDSALPQRAD